MIETRAPGKLFIVGEYAVVEPGEPAVLVAVNRYLHCRLSERTTPGTVPVSEHVAAAVRVVDELRLAQGLPERFFDIAIDSELDEVDGRKFGLGSSAAVTVAVIAALDRLYRLQLTTMDRFKLALLATVQISPRASGGDLAASTFGGWVRYRSPDRNALLAHHTSSGVVAALQSDLWQHCEVVPLSAPTNLQLLVGWTGTPASTAQLVDRAAANGSATEDAELHRSFLAQSHACVDAVTDALEAAPGVDASATASTALRAARALLQRLSTARGITIETPQLKQLCQIAERFGAAAKSSGAGGGDCGIALATPGTDIAGILREWEHHGITPLDLAVHHPEHVREGAANER